ncbi:hypothetical protein BX600DRAFT_246753 [Xylariales sp. PMI_506]|nr:hypothetical protein BX600DRAFT_246753 [Xylariales sp. PMI_506]
MKESEEKIPVFTPPLEVYFVVDCPSLHIIPYHRLGARRQSVIPTTGLWEFERAPVYCPACGQGTTKTRQIPSLCLGPEGASSRNNITLTPPMPLGSIYSPSPSPDTVHSGLVPGYETTPPDKFSHLQTPPPIDDVPPPDFRPQSSCLPEPVSFIDIIDRDLEDPRPQRVASTGKPKGGGLFSLKWPGSAKGRNRQNSKDSTKAKSIISQESGGTSLPKFLSFSFSLTGKNLLMWKKDSESLVRAELEVNGGRLINLGALLPSGTDGDKSVNIRFVVEGDEWIAAVLSHNISYNRRLSLLVLHSSGLPEHSALHPLDEHAEPRCLAISPDNRYIAIGFGTKVLLLHYQHAEQQWQRILQVPEFSATSAVRFQAMSFAADSSCLVVSTQKRDMGRSEDDDTVYSSVWRCDPGANAPLRLWSCRMPTDGLSLTSIHFHPSLSLGLITGLTPTPYSLFLSPANQHLPAVPTNIHDFRIRCCCASPSPNSNILYFLDARNKIFRVDLQSQSFRQIADLHTTRGALKPQEEPAALSVTADGQLRVFWRQGPGLWCVDVRERVAPQKKNLREIWLEAVGDG